MTKRDTSTQNVSGVVTGLFYDNGGRNVTVLGGHFSATATNGSTVNNLVFMNGSNSNAVTGVGSSLSSDSVILALAVEGDILYAGGSLTGTVNDAKVTGLVTYSLLTSSFNTQPPNLNGNVNAISIRPSSTDVYAAGSFSSAGSLGCPAVCVFSTNVAQWNRPGSNLGGTANAMTWASTNSLIVGGSLTVDGTAVSLATYDIKKQTWTEAVGASSIPGPVVALAASNSDASDLWVAGTATNGSAFLMKSTSGTWASPGEILGTGSEIRGIQILGVSISHSSSDLISADQVLLLTGAISVPGFGNASAVIFNGTTLQPFALTSTSLNNGGSLSQIFFEKQISFSSSSGKLKIGFIVLIALAIALALVFLLVLLGILLDRLQKKRQGYSPAPTGFNDRSDAMSRVPPEQLFGSIGQGRSGVERQSTRI